VDRIAYGETNSSIAICWATRVGCLVAAPRSPLWRKRVHTTEATVPLATPHRVRLGDAPEITKVQAHWVSGRVENGPALPLRTLRARGERRDDSSAMIGIRQGRFVTIGVRCRERKSPVGTVVRRRAGLRVLANSQVDLIEVPQPEPRRSGRSGQDQIRASQRCSRRYGANPTLSAPLDRGFWHAGQNLPSYGFDDAALACYTNASRLDSRLSSGFISGLFTP